MADVQFEDFSIKVKGIIADTADIALTEAAGELVSAVKRNTRVDTGQLKNSWTYKISGSVLAGEYRAYIGSPLENAIWEEYGTGEYALNGNGRKGGWYYEDVKGWGHFTYGKKPSRAFQKAYDSKKKAIIKLIQNKFKELK